MLEFGLAPQNFSSGISIFDLQVGRTIYQASQSAEDLELKFVLIVINQSDRSQRCDVSLVASEGFTKVLDVALLSEFRIDH